MLREITTSCVRSYFVKKHDCGIYSLTFNLDDALVGCHVIYNTLYSFYRFDEYADDGGTEQEIADFLPTDKSFLRTEARDGDQLTFFFIPFDMITIRTGVIIADVINNDGK